MLTLSLLGILSIHHFVIPFFEISNLEAYSLYIHLNILSLWFETRIHKCTIGESTWGTLIFVDHNLLYPITSFSLSTSTTSYTTKIVLSNTKIKIKEDESSSSVVTKPEFKTMNRVTKAQCM